jgi:hypothetical protein
MSDSRRRPGITEPVSRPLQQLLRQAVLAHATGESRRVYPPVLHAGVPGRSARRFLVEPDEELDHALRTDVVEALVRPGVERGRVPLLWLTRREAATGPDADAPVDHDWLAATTAAGRELGVLLDLVVVTRRGWHDPRTGVGRRWKRIRQR